MRSFRSVASAAAVLLASAVMVPACGKQTEGMRCEVNDDCESGLTCTPAANDRICCPAVPTTAECKNKTTVTDTGTGETSTSTDTGTAAETATDTGAGAEASTDTGTTADTATSSDSSDAD